MLNIKAWCIKLGVVLLPICLIVFVLRISLPTLAKKARSFQFGAVKNRIETDHFVIFTKMIPESPKEIAIKCEAFYLAFLNKYTSKIPFKKLQNKIEIFLYGNRKEFDTSYQEKYRRSIPHNAAFYTPTQQRIVLYWNNDTLGTLYHELTHMILDQCIDFYSPAWSNWFNEGVASYFENCHVVDFDLQGNLDQNALSYVQKAYKNNSFVPISRLIQAKASDFSSANNSLYYKESYLLIYFLIHQKGESVFLECLKKEGAFGESSPDMLSQVLQMSNIDIEKEFLDYFKIND